VTALVTPNNNNSTNSVLGKRKRHEALTPPADESVSATDNEGK
jgi:hypothetical protein